jgi:hypothetical protein
MSDWASNRAKQDKDREREGQKQEREKNATDQQVEREGFHLFEKLYKYVLQQANLYNQKMGGSLIGVRNIGAITKTDDGKLFFQIVYNGASTEVTYTRSNQLSISKQGKLPVVNAIDLDDNGQVCFMSTTSSSFPLKYEDLGEQMLNDVLNGTLTGL